MLQLTRQSSVAYLASFLARGSFVEPSLVSNAVGALLDWAGSYLDRHSDVFAVADTPCTTGAKVCVSFMFMFMFIFMLIFILILLFRFRVRVRVRVSSLAPRCGVCCMLMLKMSSIHGSKHCVRRGVCRMLMLNMPSGCLSFAMFFAALFAFFAKRRVFFKPIF